jgi:uncharacterized protein (DUF3084 family)
MPESQTNTATSTASTVGEALRTANRPAAPELVKEPSLSVSQEELHPGITVHIAVADPLPGTGELVVQAPQHTWHQFARDAREGFNVPLTVAGSYRLTLRQPREDGEWREQAHLTVEVPE